MGMTDEEARDLDKRLNPPPPTPNHPGNVVECSTAGNELTLRGIPVVGAVGGAIIGSRPGIDSARALEQAGRDILRAHLNRNRYRPEKT